MTKVSYKHVSDNPAEWTGNVMEQFYNQFPYFANSRVSVTFSQKDEQKGYALGTISIQEGPGLSVPVIIKDRELYPFDVAIMGGSTIPLTEATLQMYAQTPNAFMRTVKPDAGDITTSLFNQSHSQVITPTYITENYKQAEAKDEDEETKKHEKSESKAEEKKEVAADKKHAKQEKQEEKTAGDKTSLGVELAVDAAAATTAIGLAHYLHKNKQEKRVKEIANAKGYHLPGDEAWEERHPEISKKASLLGSYHPRDKTSLGVELAVDAAAATTAIGLAHYLHKNKQEKRVKEIANAKGYHLPGDEAWEERHPEISKKASLLDKISHTITQQMKDSFTNQLQKNASLVEGFKRNGTANLLLKIATLSPGKADYKERLHKELDRDIQYIYKSASHEYTAIFGNSRVVDPVVMTINAEAAARMEHIKTSAVLPSINKVAEAVSADLYEIAEPEVTKTASFIVNGKALPQFEVTRVYTNNGRERVEAFDGLRKLAFSRMQGIDEPFEDAGITYLPIKSVFVKLAEHAEAPMEARVSNHVVSRIDDFTYSLTGEVFNEHLKKASKAQDMHTAMWTLLQVGAAKEEVEKVAQLKVGESMAIHSNLSLPVPFEKVAEAWEQQHSALAARIDTLAKDLTKEASLITDVPTVDAVLALNFVNKNNIREFADSIPLLNEIAKKLADMLLKTRIGVQLVDEGTLRRTMLGVVDVIEALSGVSNLAGNKV